MTIRGAPADVVEGALASGNPFPGTTGFAGRIDSRLVRDVLGRVPLYVDASIPTVDPTNDDAWAFRPTGFEQPRLVPPGTTVGPNGTRQVFHLPKGEPDADPEAALDRLDAAIRTAFRDLSSPHAADESGPTDRNRAVAFSGGVDSSLVASFLDAPLYVVGFPDSHDVEAARTAASAMGRELTVVHLDLDTLETAVPRVARAIDRTNAMDVALSLPLFLLGQRVASDGFDELVLGQGADELFGGYEKIHHLDHRVEADTVRGAVREQIQTLPDELPRDSLAVEAAFVKPVFPLLHDAVVSAALSLPGELLVNERDGIRKAGLRAVASRYVPTTVAKRDKKALQYGSLVARELDRLARQAGFKRRMDDHVTRYVESRLADE